MATLTATEIAWAPAYAPAAVVSSGFLDPFTGRRASDGTVAWPATAFEWAPAIYWRVRVGTYKFTDLTLPLITAAGTGTTDVVGAHSASLPLITAAGTGTTGGIGVSSKSLPLTVASGEGITEAVGSSAESLPLITGSASAAPVVDLTISDLVSVTSMGVVVVRLELVTIPQKRMLRASSAIRFVNFAGAARTPNRFVNFDGSAPVPNRFVNSDGAARTPNRIARF